MQTVIPGIETGKWIWKKKDKKKRKFQYLLFRKVITIDSINRAKNTTAFITADSCYRLWINGQFIMVGPARGSAGKATVDILEVSSALKPGKNIIAVEVYYTNAPRFDFLSQSPGLLVELHYFDRDGRCWKTGSDSSWRVYEPNTYAENVSRLNIQRVWIEFFDGRKLPLNWQDVECNENDWQKVIELGKAGIAPWKKVEPRDIPLPVVKEIEPSAVVDMGEREGILPPDYPQQKLRIDDPAVPKELRLSQLMTGERIKIRADQHIFKGHSFSETDKPIIIEAKKGADPYIVYDFGRQVAGFIQLEVETVSGVEIDIGFSERWIRGIDAKDWIKSGNLNFRSLPEGNRVIRYITRAGYQRFETLQVTAFRYLCVVFRKCDNRAIKLYRIGVREYRFPLNSAGGFLSSDSQLNRIFESARWTAALNTVDTFMDCPHRERGGYFHDSYWTAQAVFYLFGDLSVNRRMCRQGADTQSEMDPKGMIQEMVSATSIKKVHLPFIGGHALFWVLQVGLEERFTGDKSFSKELSPNICQLFNAFEKWRNKEGLLENFPNNFLDWSNYDKMEDGVSVGLNALYKVALEEAARLTGNKNYQKQAEQVKGSINRLWNPTGFKPFYPDGFRRKGNKWEASEKMSETTQNWALWADLADEHWSQQIWQHLRKGAAPYHFSRNHATRFLQPGNLFSLLPRILFAIRVGDYTVALNDIRCIFGQMVEDGPGTLWEGIAENSTDSMCHGLGSVVAAILIEKFLGIQPGEEGGFSHSIIRPQPADKLEWAKGYITTRDGIIKVDWRYQLTQFELLIILPGGYRATVVLPSEVFGIWVRKAAGNWPQKLEIKESSRITVTPGKVEISGKTNNYKR